MKKLIDADVLIKALENTAIRFPVDKCKMFQLIEDAPAVFVTEVSCEDPNTEYITFPYGLRLIIREGKYAGWYVCK